MCRTDRSRRAAALVPLALALTFGAAAAQTSFDDGSFAAGAAGAEEPAAKAGGWPAAPAGGFGGSFEGEAGKPAGGSAEAGADGFGGSFEGAAGAAGQPPADGAGAEATATQDAEPPAEETTEATAPAADAEAGAAEDSAEAEPPREGEEAEPALETAEGEPDDDGEMAQTGEAGAADDPILAFEMRDYGVPATGWLRQGAFHAATPVVVPGGTVITTDELSDAISSNEVAFVLIDVLGGEYRLPNALSATGLAQPGTYNDRTQQQAMVWLAQVTGGDPDVPIVLYCSDPMCWMSYNAALRTIAAGYTNVYWYRGGLQAWQMAGLPVFPSGF